MSAGKKRQTMAKQARERAVREKRALKAERKEERKRIVAEGGVMGEDGMWVMPAGDETEAEAEAVQGLHLVTDEESAPSEATAEPGPANAERDEGELRGAHA